VRNPKGKEVSSVVKEKEVKPIAVKQQGPMWIHFDVRIQMRDRLVGGYPQNLDAEKAMLEARGLANLIPPQPDLEAMTDEERKAFKDSQVQKSWVGFKTDGNGLYLEGRNIKAMFKECANILKGPSILDVKNFKSKLAERLFVMPNQIALGDKPDGYDSRVVHAMTAMGPRSSIKFFDYFNRPLIEFQLKVLNDGVVTEKQIQTILEYAQENGLGADRSQGEGQFDLVSLNRID
jgi:hypothetical protein